MFRTIDIYSIAIQIERNGEAAYRQAAAKTDDPRLCRLLNWLADEEARHRRWFTSQQARVEVSGQHPELEAMGQSLLREMVANQTFSLDQEQLSRSDTIAELLAQFRTFEQDTILFYEFLHSLVDDDQAAGELTAIIDEERRHAARLEELAAAQA
ncbi:MAG: ferritin family protein [Desulfopila sp.]